MLWLQFLYLALVIYSVYCVMKTLSQGLQTDQTWPILENIGKNCYLSKILIFDVRFWGEDELLLKKKN